LTCSSGKLAAEKATNILTSLAFAFVRSYQRLPTGGTGIRFLLSKKFRVNLRPDFAWCKDNFTWSMGRRRSIQDECRRAPFDPMRYCCLGDGALGAGLFTM
jgi:hypothetical protein